MWSQSVDLLNPVEALNIKTAIVQSDYDPDTRLKIVRNVDGDIIFKIMGNGEMRIATSGGQFHGKDLNDVCDAASALIDALSKL